MNILAACVLLSAVYNSPERQISVALKCDPNVTVVPYTPPEAMALPLQLATVTPQATAPIAAPPQATARKATARKATARKATARKATARKATARKATARKATARKATARKATARKATRQSTTKIIKLKKHSGGFGNEI